jgi:ABC-type nitrate/sulfonate/bicarbonate transport system substrate-binding protein
MQWLDRRLIEQIIDGRKTATVRRLPEGAGIDEYNTALHVGAVYQVYDADCQPRVAVRLTAVELARWGRLHRMRAFTFFLDWELNCQFAGPIWAREKDLYRQAGLEVQLLPPSAQPRKDLIDLVLENDCAAGSIEENLIVRAAMAGKPVRVVAAMLKQTPLVLITARCGPIKTLADLPGRRVAMHGDGMYLLVPLLKLNGIDPKSVDLAVGDWSLEDLVEGRFDAVQGYAITEAQALAKSGFEAELIPLSHPNLDPHSQVIFASVQSIAHRKNFLRTFLRATFEGWRQVLAHPDEAAVCVAAHSTEHADPFVDKRNASLSAG